LAYVLPRLEGLDVVILVSLRPGEPGEDPGLLGQIVSDPLAMLLHVVDSIRKLKELPGKELQVHGSGGLAQTLIRNRLVDEYRLWVFPVALGTGKRLFADGTVPTAFERADVRMTEAGVTVLTFRPLGEPRLGTHEIEAGAEAIKLAE
jgi:hypothetical protein